jgi:hypothetical protein
LIIYASGCKKDVPQYSLKVNVNPIGCGTVYLSPPGNTYSEGTEVTLSPSANVYYLFAKWTGSDGSLVTNNKIVMSKDMEITANFDKYQFTLAMSVSPAGSGTVTLSPGGGTYDVGTEVTITLKRAVFICRMDWE